MAVLPETGLRTLENGGQGSAELHDDNIEDIDDKLRGPFKANSRLGDLIVADTTTNQAQSLTFGFGTAVDVIPDVSAAYSQTEIRNVIESLVDEINKLRTDRDNLKTKVNEILTNLDITNGCGVLADN